MNKTFKKIAKYILARPSIELARLWPLLITISAMRRLNEIQLSAEQLKIIAVTVKDKAPCKLLIFGLGYDSVFWLKLNRGGVTIFLENNDDWLQKIAQKSKEIIAYAVNYNTKLIDWQRLLESPSLLDMTLPRNVTKEKWDIIFVDGPEGWDDQTPGRMKSIYLSSILANNSGDIFVHDCNREVENIYCNKFLKKENLKVEIKAPIGSLRHYHMIG